MTEEKIMELGKEKDKFALKVCEFYNFWEKPFLLNIPQMYINLIVCLFHQMDINYIKFSIVGY
jgi:hypothetical protein